MLVSFIDTGNRGCIVDASVALAVYGASRNVLVFVISDISDLDAFGDMRKGNWFAFSPTNEQHDA